MTFYCAGSDSKTRIIHTRLLALLTLLLLMISGNRIENTLREGLLNFAGLSCVIISAFGRVWSSIYISGYKTGALVELGPYSVTRNPLYLFSLIGAVGIGLASGSLLILALLTLSFGVYYPFVIRKEEQDLKGRHGPEFLSYMERVPGFFPKLSLYSEPATYLVKTKELKRALLDASYFMWIYGALQLILKLREAGILPAFFRIP
ncbi:MAG: isoprenylcysteine carboxylmethyltransferase family protein [Syntrophobacteraceae bacterium]